MSSASPAPSPPATPSGWRSPVLQNRDFRSIFMTRFFVSVALQIQAVIVGWQIYKLRPDPLFLGLMGLTEAVPAITCSFFSGHAVDNTRPSLVFRLSILVTLLNTLMIFFAVLPATPLEDTQRLILLYVGIFISGASRSFTSPAVFSLIPMVIPRKMIGAASAWTSSAYQFASIFGPAIGGLVYSGFGATAAFALPPVMMVIAWFSIETLSKEGKSARSDARREPFVESIKAGIGFAFHHKVLLSTMTLDMFSVLFGGAVAVLPIFADQIFHTGAHGLGYLRAAPSVGSVIVAVYLALRPLKRIKGRTLLWVVAGFGFSTLFFALSKNFYLALFFLALSGMFDGVSMVIRSTLLQLLTPDKMRGRISALSSVFITSSNEIGAFESGLAARFMGLVTSVVAGGVMTLVVVATTAWSVPELRKVEVLEDGTLG